MIADAPAPQDSALADTVLHHLVTTVPRWDTVDVLAAHVAGPLVAADPSLTREMDRWIDDRSL